MKIKFLEDWDVFNWMCEYGSDFVQSAIAQILEHLGAERTGPSRSFRGKGGLWWVFWRDCCSGNAVFFAVCRIRKYSVLIGPATSDGDFGSPVKVAYATPFSLKLAFLRLSLFSLLWRGIWRLVNNLSLIRLLSTGGGMLLVVFQLCRSFCNFQLKSCF